MMKTKALVGMCAILLLAGGSSRIGRLRAQEPAGRIAGEIDDTARLTLNGTHPPLATSANDVGRVAPETALRGMELVFKRSAAQEADLQALIAAQQNPSSPLYHQWLTPDEFASRYGMTDSDLAKSQSWLESHGFSVDGISRSHNRIIFSGTVAQVQSAFGTELHYYSLNGETHFAPSSDLSIPAALAPVVLDVTNLSSFRPKPRLRKPKANFTSGLTGHTYLTPKDVATIYDVNPVYTAGFDGAGQTIAVVGQSSVSVTDMENFETAAALPVKDPTLVLVPTSGNVAEFQGDESESDLDLEYSGGIAPGATIVFIYTGDSANFSVWDSITYAIENDVAPIVSDSYGICEPGLAAGEYSTLNGVLQQGAAQGQSVIVPAGDSGSADCEGVTFLTTAQQQALAVDFPASSQYVTAMGGSEFPASIVCDSNCSTPNLTYWQFTSSTDIISSAVSGVTFPEQAWNDDAPPSNGNAAFLGSGGGGVSTLTTRPAWQTGVPGITGTMRLVPDLALSASPNNAGYLYCSSDTSAWDTANAQVASCNSGFRDASSSLLTVAGGTSFDAPLFAGLVAVINQKQNSVGQGVLGAILYPLASNTNTYASAFHDIKTGSNNCSVAGATVCSGSSLTQYLAGTGYDLATGLGSIDFNNLLAAWPAMSGSSLKPSRTTLSAASDAPAINASDAITITVSGSGTPTGTVNVAVGCPASLQSNCSPSASSLPLSGGSATYNFVPSVGGSQIIRVTYSGDAIFGASTATLALDNQSFRLTSTNPTIAAGSNGSSAITITPQGGYSGSISWTVSSSPSFTNGCFSLPNATVSGTAVTTTLTLKTNSTACGGSAMLLKSGGPGIVASANRPRPMFPLRRMPLGLAIAGLVFGGVFVSRPAKICSKAGTFILLTLLLGFSACGGGSSSGGGGGGGSNVAPGNYTLTVVGTDTSSSTISGSTAVFVTVQ